MFYDTSVKWCPSWQTNENW